MTDILTGPAVIDYHIVYSPEYGEYNGKTRLKKYFGENANDELKSVRDFVLGVNEREMNKGGKEY